MSTSPVKRVQGQPRAQNSPSPEPGPASPYVLNPGSPVGMTVRGCLPTGSSILHASECPNKGINILASTVLPGTTFPDVQLELGCTTMCFVHLGSKTGPDNPVIAPAPRPMGFQTALASIFGDERVNTVDAQALAELAAMASSYQPSPETPNTVQIPDSQPAGDTVMEKTNSSTSTSQVLIPFVPESSIPELPMDMGNGQNMEKTGLGDSQQAHLEPPWSVLTPFSDPSLPYLTSAEPPPSPIGFASSWPNTASQIGGGKTIRSVRFSSPLARIWSPKGIPDTFSEASGSIQTNSEEERVTIDMCQLLDKKGATPENTGLSEDFLNGAATSKDLINYMAILEDSMEKKMSEMEEHILASVTRARNPQTPRPNRFPQTPQQTRKPRAQNLNPPAPKPNLVPVRNPAAAPAL